ncbi:hypothetical protein NL108_001688 [Boleophthalmus pectinirostris]|nr:hypothetical protein NL108_001688 [Boleophthalmus pectinirostris]
MDSRAVFVAVVLLLVGAFAAADSDCSNLDDCETCGTNMDCQWANCSSTIGCVNKTVAEENCSNATCSAVDPDPSITPTTTHKTPAPPPPSTTTVFTTVTTHNATENSTATVTPSVTPSNSTNTTSTTTTTAPSNATTSLIPTAEPHHNTFDAASFIGGIVLVLGIQAVIFSLQVLQIKGPQLPYPLRPLFFALFPSNLEPLVEENIMDSNSLFKQVI